RNSELTTQTALRGPAGRPPPRVENRVRGVATRCVPFPNRETQFRPGQSGNPGGRPRGESLAAQLRRFLDGETETRTQGQGEGQAEAKGRGVRRRRRDLLLEKLFERALQGDARLIKLIFERTDGRIAGNIDEADAIAQLQAELAELRQLYNPQEGDD